MYIADVEIFKVEGGASVVFSEELDGSVSGRRSVSEIDHNIMNDRRESK